MTERLSEFRRNDWANKIEKKRLKERLAKKIKMSKFNWETKQGKTKQIKLRRGLKDWKKEKLKKYDNKTKQQ